MKITYLKLENFSMVKSGMGLDTLELDFTKGKNMITLIVGNNGTGKTGVGIEKKGHPNKEGKTKYHCFSCGEDFDKVLKSYDTLRKSADFTPKNIKNACDFDSVGEIFAYCEKKGWENAFYDDTPRDTVDLVMKDVQSWLRNLYKNETGIAEDVERRINALKMADDMEATIMAVEDDGMDDFDAAGYDVESFDEGAGL